MTPTKLLLCAALGLTACGGAPPPPPAPTGPTSLGAMAPETPELMKIEAHKRYTVVFDGQGLPAPGALEDALARASVVGSVEAVGEGLEVSVAGAACAVTLGGPLPKAHHPEPFHALSLEAQGIEREQAQKVIDAKATAEVRCTPDEAPAVNAAQGGADVAEALARLTEGFIYDPQARRHWARGAWGRGAERQRFDIHRIIWAAPDPERTGVVATRGMAALGLPDLVLAPVAEADQEEAARQLYLLAFGLTVELGVGPGSALSSGRVEMVLLDWATYRGALGDAGEGLSLPPGTERPLAVVDPKAAPGDADATGKLVRRLAIR